MMSKIELVLRSTNTCMWFCILHEHVVHFSGYALAKSAVVGTVV